MRNGCKALAGKDGIASKRPSMVPQDVCIFIIMMYSYESRGKPSSCTPSTTRDAICLPLVSVAGSGAGSGAGSEASGGAGGAARLQARARRAQHRVTHNEKRYHSGTFHRTTTGNESVPVSSPILTHIPLVKLHLHVSRTKTIFTNFVPGIYRPLRTNALHYLYNMLGWVRLT